MSHLFECPECRSNSLTTATQSNNLRIEAWTLRSAVPTGVSHESDTPVLPHTTAWIYRVSVSGNTRHTPKACCSESSVGGASHSHRTKSGGKHVPQRQALLVQLPQKRLIDRLGGLDHVP